MKGEITARSKYAHRLSEASCTEIVTRAKPKIEKSQSQFIELSNQGLDLSPFLEIGSGYCERSMLLATKFKANGFAADLSYHELQFAEMDSKVLGMNLPYRICCDVHNLPFKNSSFPFVFCYETLHHFSNPIPVIKEIVRVLDSGIFFFDDEPVKNYLRLPLNYPINIRKRHQRGWVAYFISHFLRRSYSTTMEYGITENEDISINDWNEILSSFNHRDVVAYIPGLRSRFRSKNPASVFDRILVSNLDSSRFSFGKIIVNLVGATISGVCFGKKSDGYAALNTENIFDLLACPNCLEVNRKLCDAGKCKTECKLVCNQDAIKIEGGKAKISQDCSLCFDCLYICPLNAIEKPKLFRTEIGFVCYNCWKPFLIINNILMLFSEEQGKNLYPKLLGSNNYFGNISNH